MFGYYMCTWGLQRSKEDISSPKSGVINDCESPLMGTGNQSWVLCQSCKCS